jgi:hypothetical protein
MPGLCSRDASMGCWVNVEAWQPATGIAPPLQVEICRHPPTSAQGG